MNDEELVVELIKKRMERGRELYGLLKLTEDNRDLVQEALEEALDLAVYTASRLIQIQRTNGIDPRPL